MRCNRTGRPTAGVALMETLEDKRMLSTTWYVSTVGSDNNPGTGRQPFASIARASWSAKPGDTVLVRGGVYHPTQQIWIGTSGKKHKSITYKPFKKEKVTLDGSWMQPNTDLVSIGGDYVTLQGFTIQNSRQIGVVVLEANGVRITGNRVTGSSWQGIAGWGSKANAYTDLVVEGNTIDNNGHGFFNEAAATFAQGVAIQKCAKVTVRGNTVYGNWGEGILLSQDGAGSTIESNKTHDNFGIEIYLMDQNGAIVRNNFTYTTGDKTHYRYGAPSRGVQIANETWGAPIGGKRNQIVNNVSVGNSFGFYYGNYYVGGGMHDNTLANNTWVNSTDGTIHVDAASHSGNKFVNNITSQSAKKAYVSLGSTAGFSFANNLWWGKGSLIAAAKSKTDLFVDPKFVKPNGKTASDYKLQTSSTAINRGTRVSFTVDFASKKRSAGRGVDLGAFEIR